MSSPFPRDRTISVIIPATIKTLIVTAEYFIYLNDRADNSEKAIFLSEPCCIDHLIIVVAFSLMIAADVSKNVQSSEKESWPPIPF
jgi:hypothetical protein